MRKVFSRAEGLANFRRAKEAVAHASGRGVGDGAEEDEGCGFGIGQFFVGVRMKRRTQDGVGSRTCSGCHDTFGIQSHLIGMEFEKREGRLGVHDGIFG